jgi:NADH dehydrogenase
MKKRIIIAGGGFAGLYAAKYLDKTIARHADVEVVLISDANFTLFAPLLDEVAAGDLYPGDIINTLRRILRHVTVVEAEVEAIDLGTRTSQTARSVSKSSRSYTSGSSST